MKYAYTFDDLQITPKYSEIESRSQCELTTRFTRQYTIGTPLVASPMDTVTDSKMALAIASYGGVGIIHRFMKIGDQVKHVMKVKEQEKLVSAAIGATGDYQERASELANAGAIVLLIDVAHGNTKQVRDAIKWCKEYLPKYVDWDISHLHVAFIDIEVGSENGFPDPYRATEPITAIGIHRLGGKTKVYGCGSYRNDDENVDYVTCKDEVDLCERFLADWSSDHPDVITGWNIKFFDVPYLINRFTRILGEDDVRKMSPWSIISQRNTMFKGKQQIVYDIVGVSAQLS